MKGTKVIVSAQPQGKFIEGIISGTPKPGTLMEIYPAVAPVGGRFTWRAATRSSGAKGGVFVLTEDELQGKLITDAYVTGTRGFMYAPIAGEELNLLVEDQSGTGDDATIGALYGVDTTGGLIAPNSGFASAPFCSLEAKTDPTADYILWCLYLGNLA